MPSPLITAAIQATGLSAVSNLCAQIIKAHQAQRPFSLDLAALARFVLLTILTAPPNWHWQQWLERTFPAYVPSSTGGTADAHERDLEKAGFGQEAQRGEAIDRRPKLNIRNTLTKWFVDCIFLGAILNTVAFLVIMGILKGQSLKMMEQNLRTETIPIIVAGYKIWPFASIVSFSFIPVERRVVFLSFVGMLWGIYMSLVAAQI